MSTVYSIKRIYLVQAAGICGGDVLRAFASADGAEKFKKRWESHRRQRPPYPAELPQLISSWTDEQHELCDQWYAATERWRKRTPGGAQHSDHNLVSIISLGIEK